MEAERNFPQYLQYKDRTYSVCGYIGEVDDYKDNKGYIDRKNGRIFICSKNEPPAHTDVPIMYVNEDGSITIKDANAPQILEVFRDAYLYDLSYQSIVDLTKEDEQLYNEEALADINAATTVFVPTINDDDDPLKKIIKQTIISKKIDINRLKHKMPQKYGLTNMKSALIGKTKMSITNFNIWCELLGVTYDIVISDNGTDMQNPLRKPIHFNSGNGRLQSLER